MAGGVYHIKDRKNARDVALYALLNINNNGRKSNVFLRETLDKTNELSVRDKALCEHIVSSTLSHLYGIDEVIDRYSKLPSNKLNPYVREILRLSVCQLLYMDRIPSPAVLNEGAELAKMHGLSGLSGYINAVLRNIERDRTEPLDKTRIGRAMGEGSIRYSVPKWLYIKLVSDFGKDAAHDIFDAWLLLRKTSVRYNMSRGMSESEITALIEKDGIRAFKISEAPPVYELDSLSGMGVEGLEAFRKGYVTVQDASAALLTRYCPPKKGSLVIDVCAAPGGKSLSYADCMEDTGTVIARDISEEKVGLIRENAGRCGFSCIRAEVFDALSKDREHYNKADIVIADLPCSGLGVAAKKPDIKKNLSPGSITGLVKLQRDIFDTAVRYLKPGGRIVYSTCTVTKEENEENAYYFADKYGLEPLVMERITPGLHRDGFFIAVFKKR